jgi:hypothetical protein
MPSRPNPCATTTLTSRVPGSVAAPLLMARGRPSFGMQKRQHIREQQTSAHPQRMPACGARPSMPDAALISPLGRYDIDEKLSSQLARSIAQYAGRRAGVSVSPCPSPFSLCFAGSCTSLPVARGATEQIGCCPACSFIDHLPISAKRGIARQS